MGLKEVRQLPFPQEPSRWKGGTLFLLLRVFQVHGGRHTAHLATGSTIFFRFSSCPCYVLTDHHIVLSSETRCTYLGAQDWLSPLWCDLPKSPPCESQFLLLQVGLDSELFSPHPASSCLSLCLCLSLPLCGSLEPWLLPRLSSSLLSSSCPLLSAGDMLLEMALKLFSSPDKIFST